MGKTMLYIFTRIVDALVFISGKTGISYNQVNIILYYMLIPLSWAVILDIYIGIPLTSLVILLIWTLLLLGKRGHFHEWCETAFYRSVAFINYFNRWGGNYILNSVTICVVFPILVYTGLIWLVVIK